MKSYDEVLEVIEKLRIHNQRIHQSILGTKKELRSLPDVMSEDEYLLYATPGIWKKKMWLMVCTNERIILLHKGMTALKTISIPIKQVYSFRLDEGRIFKKITLSTGSKKLELSGCLAYDAERFLNAVKVAKTRKEDGKYRRNIRFSKIK